MIWDKLNSLDLSLLICERDLLGMSLPVLLWGWKPSTEGMGRCERPGQPLRRLLSEQKRVLTDTMNWAPSVLSLEIVTKSPRDYLDLTRGAHPRAAITGGQGAVPTPCRELHFLRRLPETLQVDGIFPSPR